MTKISRRKFSELGLLSAAAMPFFSFKNLVIKNKISSDFPKVRVDISKRNYIDEVVEATILRIKENCKDKEIAWLFENCFPNTLDTTVSYEEKDGIPDTFVITGDIDAMWLRDSTAQVWPYLDLAVKSDGIKKLIQGVINRQSKCIQIDPYANAFNHHPHRGDWFSDHTDMKEELHERKWEIDSLCYPVRLAYHFWKKTGDKTAFSDSWFKTAQTIFKTFKEQQRFDGPGPYRFGRTTSWSTDTVPGNGYGNNTRPNGLIHSTFRPSDDATLYPFLIPANYFALVSLKQMAEISKTIYHNDAFAADCT